MTHQITFEWVVEEQTYEALGDVGQEMAAQRLHVGVGEQVITQGLLRVLSLALVALIAVGAAGLTPEERLRREAENGIAFTVNRESQAWRSRTWDLYLDLIDPNVDEMWISEWRDNWRDGSRNAFDYKARVIDVRPAGDLMRATIEAEHESVDWEQTSRYREERFYRRVGQDWVRTVPPRAYWGEPRQLETAHLRFTYYEHDAAIVEAAAPQLDSAYAAMYEMLGIEGPPAGKLLVAVQPYPARRWGSVVDGLDVTSPVFEQIPVGQSQADYLAYEVTNWFTYRALRDAAPSSAARYLYRWPILVWGLRGWLREELLEPATPWRTEALQVLRESNALPFSLSNVTELRSKERPTREEVIVRYLAAESFVAFVVDTYGEDRLPEFMAAIVRYGSWDEIIQKLYGHSSAKFVADWNLYVMEYYIEE